MLQLRGNGRAAPDQVISPHEVTIRAAGEADGRALRRLAGLDSRHLPCDDFLIAEVGGEPRAAIGLSTGEVVADPFNRTANVVELLRLRAADVASSTSPGAGWRPLHLGPRPEAAAPAP